MLEQYRELTAEGVIIMLIVTFFAVFFIVIGILTAIILAYDCFHRFNNICRRMGIGGFETHESWKSAVDNKTLEWFKKTPVVISGGDHRLILLHKILNARHKKSVQMWQIGGILLGVSAFLAQNIGTELSVLIEQSFYRRFIEDNKWLDQTGKIDNALIAYALLKMPFYKESYRPVMDKAVDSILYNLQEDGTIAYRKENKDIRLVDTIGMICPFLALYGVHYKKEEMIELALKQIREYVRYTVFQNCFLPAHAYSSGLKVPFFYGWGRGIGWLALGLIDTYGELPDGHQGGQELKAWICRLSETVKGFQLENGGWSCSWAVKGNPFDASSTAMLVYFLKKSVSHGLIPEDVYLPVIAGGEDILKKVTRRDGTVDFSQGDTKDIGCYSQLFAPMPFTQGIVTLLLNI